ncbi:hypothetical protein B5G12_01445 [Faecalibacterium sp. An58]|uniref:hypothetical protein n=1 Tax=Faecalibacterium sp. An58 TaxID=1965648 RepID=UPI000B385BBA|nr:hypothetical protein [Faecalibacterium sp. An58]OUN75762.1 hypothetical protein B5G12_01445 [Faecalibacterium sp. An58]
MSWQDIVTISSFIIGGVSLVIGVFSLYFSYVSMQRTGSIQDALKEQADAFSRKQFARDLLPKVQKLSQTIAKHPDDSKQLQQELFAASGLLSELKFSVQSTQEPVFELLDMLHEDYNAQARAENPVHSFLDYSNILGKLIALLKKEAD